MHNEGSWYGNVVLDVDRGCGDLEAKDFFGRFEHDAVEAVNASRSWSIIALAPMSEVDVVQRTID